MSRDDATTWPHPLATWHVSVPILTPLAALALGANANTLAANSAVFKKVPLRMVPSPFAPMVLNRAHGGDVPAGRSHQIVLTYCFSVFRAGLSVHCVRVRGANGAVVRVGARRIGAGKHNQCECVHR